MAGTGGTRKIMNHQARIHGFLGTLIPECIDEEMGQDPGFKSDIIASMKVMSVDCLAAPVVFDRALTATRPIRR